MDSSIMVINDVSAISDASPDGKNNRNVAAAQLQKGLISAINHRKSKEDECLYLRLLELQETAWAAQLERSNRQLDGVRVYTQGGDWIYVSRELLESPNFELPEYNLN